MSTLAPGGWMGRFRSVVRRGRNPAPGGWRPVSHLRASPHLLPALCLPQAREEPCLLLAGA